MNSSPENLPSFGNHIDDLIDLLLDSETHDVSEPEKNLAVSHPDRPNNLDTKKLARQPDCKAMQNLKLKLVTRLKHLKTEGLGDRLSNQKRPLPQNS